MPTLLAFCSFVLALLGGYGYFNQPLEEPAWPTVIPGFAFSPLRADQSPLKGQWPSEAQIRADLALLKGKARSIRTYTVDGVMHGVPALAAEQGLKVTVGAWIGKDEAANRRELAQLVPLLRPGTKNVTGALIGNEALLRNDVDVTQMMAYLDQVRAHSAVPVSTAEPAHIWLTHPELVKHVDYIALHLLPYWEGIALDAAVGHALNTYERIRTAHPGKRIVVTEVGWPSQGRSIGDAVASPAHQAIFLRRFIARAQAQGMEFYVMEAFDQPWKAALEGSVGSYWGVFDADRQAKFEMHNPIIAVPQWKLLAGASVLVALLLSMALLADSSTLKNTGRSFLLFNAFSAASLIVYVGYDFTQQYHTVISGLVSLLMLLGVTGVFVIVLCEAHEWAEAAWYTHRRRLLVPGNTPRQMRWEHAPWVSIHVPAYDEPAEVLRETLRALARLDYPHFEVIVVDNNTPDESTWKPIQALCSALGERFRFFHVSPLAGHKAGALNFALAHTRPDADIVAVVDADYQVQADWLKQLVPAFSKQEVAIVQAPQDYRDGGISRFKAMCMAEYAGFFHLGMVTRNERNAIIQHGTMTLVRKSSLLDAGAWGTETITEDAELGLRILALGHEAVYVTHSFGQGLMPDTFADYKRQRHRWAYGAMQILRQHGSALLGRTPTRLTPGQRYHFFSGWLPWMADGLNVLFTTLAIVWTGLMAFDPIAFNAPPLLISAVPVAFFVFKICKMLFLYVTRIRTSLRVALAAAVAGLALSHAVGRATLSGLLLGRDLAFFRTPKTGDGAQPSRSALSASLRALQSAREEALLAGVLWTGALYLAFGMDIGLGVGAKPHWMARETVAWCIVLVFQSLPYLAACAMALIQSWPSPAEPKAWATTHP